jgi:hypothetical protein
VVPKLKTGNICIKTLVSNFALLFNCFIPFDLCEPLSIALARSFAYLNLGCKPKVKFMSTFLA